MAIPKTYKVVAVIFIALFALILYKSIAMTKVNVSDITDATITFVYCDKNINEKLTSEEAETLKSIVNGKRLFEDQPACGFSPDISFSFGNMIFSVANDTCEIIKFETTHGKHKRKATDMYLFVTEQEKQKIYDVFNKYGGFFPCV